MDASARPRSAIPLAVGAAGLVAALAVLHWAFRAELDPALSALVVMGAAVIPALVFDGAPKAFRAWRAGRSSSSIARLAIKLVGAFAAIGVAAVAILVFPFFHRSELAALIGAAPGLALFGLPLLALYIVIADRVADKPEDRLYAVGAATLGLRYDLNDLTGFALTQAIKLFFFTLMLTYLSQDIAYFRAQGAPMFDIGDFAGVERLNRLVFTCDVVLAGLGYFATLSLFGWEVREPDRTLSGWVACLVCYEPFFNGIGAAFLAYHGPGDWRILFSEGSPAYWGWTGAFLACNLIYLSATVAFGPLFSNITRRGIITSGPYRFTKHPAYLGKNIGWWIYEAPFMLTTAWPNALSRGLMLLGVNAIYFIRARCEERLLAQDPVYRNYAASIARSGLIARLCRWLRRHASPQADKRSAA
jgi:protein-S-isoprenylcysteine O-methyltransferase Ste14